MSAAIDLAGKLATFTEAWQPRTVSLFNGHDVMVAKLRGDYHWHVHDDSDDFFLVLAGSLEIDLDDGTTVTLGPGQHTLQLVLGDWMHTPFNPPLMSPVVTVTVK